MVFYKSCAFVFGSGLVIVPFLHGGVVNEYHWLNEHEFIDAVAVAMITPGPVCNNSRFHRLFSSRFPRSICCRIDNIFTLLFIYNFTCTFYAFLYNKKDEYKNKPYFSKTFILYSVNHFYQIYIPFTSFDQNWMVSMLL